jgi:poly(3-hydroxyalkanoate) synthetase
MVEVGLAAKTSPAAAAQEGGPINLKNFKEPIFVFASSGDNITPRPQALNWIYKVYGSVCTDNGQI